MSFRIGIYDLFAYTIPGLVYLALIIYLDTLFDLINSLDFYKLNIAHLIAASGLAFVLGLVFDPISDNLWFSLLKTKNSKLKAIDEMVRRYPEFSVNVKPDDWILFLDHIKNRNLEMGSEFDSVKAQSKMMKNISFGLLLFGLSFLVAFFIKDSKIVFLIGSITYFLFSVILILKANKFHNWYYCFIFEAIISEQIKIENYVKYSQPNKNTSSE